jgi:signal transduction histidine kinase
LFERFFRAQNASNIEGTGLGLNIVKKYVELIGGEISFVSKLNQGTAFTINIEHKEIEF